MPQWPYVNSRRMAQGIIAIYAISYSPIIRLTPSKQRLYDWKNTTRAKHKKSLNCSDKNLYSLTLLENRALKIFYAQQLKKEQAADYLGDADQGEEDVKAEEFEDVDEDEDEFEEPQEVYPQTEPIIINAGLTSTQRLHLDGIGSILYEGAYSICLVMSCYNNQITISFQYLSFSDELSRKDSH